MEKNGMTLTERFYYEMKCAYIDEIIAETKWLKELKSFYVKHAFDSMGNSFKIMYNKQEIYLKKLKQQYKDKYETAIDKHCRFSRTFTS